MTEAAAKTKLWKERLTSRRTYQFLEILAVFSPAMLMLIILEALQPENPMIFFAGVWAANLCILLLIWGGIRLRGETLGSIGLSFGPVSLGNVGRAVFKSILILVFALAAFIFGSAIMLNLGSSAPPPADMSQYNYLQGNLPMLLVSLAGVYIVSSFAEEVIYRGFLITRLKTLFGETGKPAATLAVLISAIVFGVAHYKWGLMGVVQTTFMGAALGLCFFLTKRRLFPLILAHAILDTVLLVQLYAAPVAGP